MTLIISGAGTNLRVGGGTDAARKWGHRFGAKCRKKILVVPFYFLAIKVRIVVLVSALVMVSTVWSVFFFAVLLTVPSCPIESAPLLTCIMHSCLMSDGKEMRFQVLPKVLRLDGRITQRIGQ